MAKVITGEIFKNMITLAAEAVEAQKEQLNQLNVFPVPDGDTGTNMSLTLNAAATELGKHAEPTLTAVCEHTSSSLLRGARGNSGVITSLLFRGITKALKDLSNANAGDFANALEEGVNTAYKAVMKPAEGTILTVSRVSAEAAVLSAMEGQDLIGVFNAAIEAAKKELPNTMELNPVLKKAGVVDAGAYGYIIILEGMYSAITGTKPQQKLSMPQKPVTGGVDYLEFDPNDITYGYCTEFIAERTNQERSVPRFKAMLESIGDSVVVVEDDAFIKVHVHTDNPDRALGEALKFGTLSSIKIENMREQFESLAREQGLRVLSAGEVAATGNGNSETVTPEKPFGFVSVAAGEGLEHIFMDLGVDRMVEGGQTMNPSTQDILNSIEQTPAEVVFVLPNNKNIIMASEQTVSLTDKQVVVIPTRSVPEGIAALLAFDGEADVATNQEAMTAAAKAVTTGQVTYAARNAEIDGHKIAEGDFMALINGRLTSTSKTEQDVLESMAQQMCSTGCVYITIIYGEGANEESAQKLAEIFEAKAQNAEINVIFGGQPVYSYIVSVE